MTELEAKKARLRAAREARDAAEVERKAAWNALPREEKLSRKREFDRHIAAHFGGDLIKRIRDL
ncbi:MAG TPA: hypothetical protein VGG68_00815 [Caulobacteraceae bacterium]|jgi:hypothetical protein